MSKLKSPLPSKQSSLWYKEPVVWLMLGLLGTSMSVVLFFVFTAVKYGDSVVRDNYYKEGLAINQELKLDEQAATLGLNIDLQFHRSNNTVTAKLENLEVLPDFIQMSLIHPTLKEQDQDILMQKSGDVYRGQVSDYIDGNFHIHVSSPIQLWRIRQLVALSDQTSTTLKPSK